ncbi:MAG: TonB-dependent receptor plug domain-containing protein [Lacunisphaera sp.]
MKYTYLKPSLLLAVALAAAGPLARGQTVDPKTTASTDTKVKDSKSDDTVVLSPFTVTSSDDEHGYTATDSLAGTRLRTDLRDIGAAISVVTKDFLNDTGITNAGTLLTYATNTEVGGVHGNYSGFGTGTGVYENRINPQSTTRIRGLDGGDNTRDYFLTNIPWDSYNIDRIDTVRGPNSILYGLGSPAGIINTTLNDARFKNKTVIETRFGRFGSYRGSLDTNVVLLPNELALRINSEYSATQYRQDPAFNNDFRQFGALRYDPRALNIGDRMTTTIKASFEHGKISSNNPTNSPPVDAISPWFDPTKGNRFTTDPFITNNANLTNPTWTFHGIVTDYSPNGGSGNGVPNQADGSLNPYFNPWVGVPFQSGATVLTGVSPQVPGGQTYFQPSLSLGNSPSVLHNSINSIAYNQFSGVNTYDGYAGAAKIPGYTTGLFKSTDMLDRSVFDYYDKLIGGDNARQWQNWTSFNASLSQTFLSNRVGYEAAFHQEQYHNGQWAIFNQGNGTLELWTQNYTADGRPDPNFGKPYITSTGQYGNNSQDDRNTDVRITGFGEVRGSDFVDSTSKLAHIIGRQRVTGLYSTYAKYQEDKSWMLYATDPSYDQTYQPNNSQAINLTNYAPHIVSFLGGSLANAASLSGANLSYASHVNVPLNGSINQFIPKWTAPATLDPNGVWVPPAGQPGAINADNSANYQGWTPTPVHILSAFNGDQNSLYTSGDKQETKVASKAFIWQGYFFDGLVVPLIGVRKDTVRTSSAQPGQNTDGTKNLSDPSYQLGTQTIESGTTRSYSIVAHLPARIKSKLPWGMDVSAYYNQSENFQPGSGRVDVYGASLADPSGTTKDYGVTVSFLENRLTLKVNKYKSQILNASSGLDNTWYIGQGLERGYVYDQFYKNDFGQDWQNHFQPNAPGQTQAQATALQGPSVAAWDQFLQDPDVKKIFTAWKLQSTGPLAWQTGQLTSQSPVGYTGTQDNVSKGYEFELSGQVTKNWTLTANASKVQAIVTNVGGAALSGWANKYNTFMQGPGGDVRIWWGGGPSIRDDWNTFWAPYSKGQIGADSDVSELRPWNFNAVTNYRFDHGFLKGLSAGGAYRWASHNIIGYPTTQDSAGNFHFDLAHPIHGPINNSVDMWLGYDFKTNSKIKWHVQLNLRNVFATDKLIPVNVQYTGVYAAYRIPEPLGWEFTTRLEF